MQIVDFTRFAQTILSGASEGALYAFVAMGFSLVHRSTGVINFAQGDLAMFGGILAAALTGAGLQAGISVVLAALICGALGGAFYFSAIRPAERATMAQLTLITIGFSILLRGFVTMVWGSNPMNVPALTGTRPLVIFNVSVLPQEIWLVGMLVVITVGTVVFFNRSVIGLAHIAGANKPVGASFVGIDHRRLALVAFIIAGLLGGLAGAVWSSIGYAQVDVGISLGIKGFTAAIIGGLSSPFGPIIGGVGLALVEAFSAGYISSAYQDAITFGLLLIVLLVRPQGILGRPFNLTAEETPSVTLVSQPRLTALRTKDWLAVAAGIMALSVPGLVLSGSWLTTSIFAGLNAIVVMGLVLLTGYAGQLSLGQGAFMMLGAYSSGYLTVNANWPPIAALCFGVVLAMLISLGLGCVIFRLRGYYMSMASLGLLMIALTFAREWSAITGGPSGLLGIDAFSIFSFNFSSDRSFYWLMLAFAVGVFLVCFFVTRSRFGRALLAIRTSESAARASGVDVIRHKVAIFVLSAAAASISGSLFAHYMSIANPVPFGFDATITQLTALTVGGFLSLWGTFAGSAVVVALPKIIALLFGSSASQIIAGLQYFIFGLLLILIVLTQATGFWHSLNIRVRTALVARKLAGQKTGAEDM